MSSRSPSMVNIAVRVREMGAFANIDLPVDIPKLASLSSAMVRKALQAFIEAVAELAQSVLQLDDQVDELEVVPGGDLRDDPPELLVDLLR